MVEVEVDNEFKVLVTGFGQFLDVKTNPSWEIVSRLPPTLQYKGRQIRILTEPEALKAAYHDLFEVPKLLEKFKPDVVIHIGLAVERDYFAVELGADRDGYHQYPDVARKVFTKAENKKAWSKSPARLNSTLDFEDLLTKWRGQAGKGVDLRISDDVGSYVCGFVYYTSLEYFWKRDSGKMPVIFMHVPPLTSKDGLVKGQNITLALIQAVSEVFRE